MSDTDTLVTDGYNVHVESFITVKGTLDAGSGAGGTSVIRLGTTWKMDQGYFTSTDSKVIFEGTSESINKGMLISEGSHFNDITLDLNSGDTTLAGSLDIDGDLVILGGSLDVSDNDHKITIGGSWTNKGGSFIAQKGLVIFFGTGSIESNGDSFYNFTLDNESGSRTLNDNIMIMGELIVEEGEFLSNGYMMSMANTAMDTQLDISGNWKGKGVHSKGIEFLGDGDVVVKGNEIVGANNFDLSGFTGMMTLGATLDINGKFALGNGVLDLSTYNNDMTIASTILISGTIVPGTGIITFDGNLTYDASGNLEANFGNVVIGASPDTITLGSSFNADSLVVNNQDTLTTDGYNVNIGSFITVKGTLDANNGAGGDSIIRLGTTWAMDKGHFMSTRSKVIFEGTQKGLNQGVLKSEGIIFNDFTLGMDSGKVTLMDTLNIQGDLTIMGGTLDVSDSGYKITLGKSWINKNGEFLARSGTVELKGAGKIEINGDAFYDVLLSGESGDNTLVEHTQLMGNLTIERGSLVSNGYALTVLGTVEVKSGATLNISGSKGKSGVYTIEPRIGNTVDVYCDMETDGGGWTLVLKNGLSIGSNSGQGKTELRYSANTSGYNVGQLDDSLSEAEGFAKMSHLDLNALKGDEVLIRQQDDDDGDGVTKVAYGKFVLNGSLKITAAHIFDVGSSTDGIYYHGADFSSSCNYSGSANNGYGPLFYNPCGISYGWMWSDNYGVSNDLRKGRLPHFTDTVDGGNSSRNTWWIFVRENDDLEAVGTYPKSCKGHQKDVVVGKGWDMTGSFVSGDSRVQFVGTGQEDKIIRSSETSFDDLRIAGTRYILADKLDIDGSINLSGELDVSDMNYQITLTGSWANKKGSFNERKGLVVLDGSNQGIDGEETFYMFSKTNIVADILYFGVNDRVTVRSTLTLRGVQHNILKLRSRINGQTYLLNSGSANREAFNINFIDVKDSDASSGKTIKNNLNVKDSGNNEGWGFSYRGFTDF